MRINNRQGRAAAALIIALLVLALIAYATFYFTRNQLPKLLDEKAKAAATANQPGASTAAGQTAAGQPAAGGTGAQNAAPASEAPKPVTVEFTVTGMTCDDCSKAIESELIKLAGVSTVSADWKAGSTKVQYDPAKVTNEQLVAAIEKLGYKAKLKEGLA